MDEQKISEIAEKIKNKTATEEEILLMIEEYTKLLKKIEEGLDTK